MFNLATLVNSILPYFFSLVVILVVYTIVIRLKWSVYKIIIALIVVGLIGAATGILV